MNAPFERTIEALYQVAEDDEADVLDRLQRKAGFTWDCPGDGTTTHWTNRVGEPCEQCGRAQPD